MISEDVKIRILRDKHYLSVYESKWNHVKAKVDSQFLCSNVSSQRGYLLSAFQTSDQVQLHWRPWCQELHEYINTYYYVIKTKQHSLDCDICSKRNFNPINYGNMYKYMCTYVYIPMVVLIKKMHGKVQYKLSFIICRSKIEDLPWSWLKYN